MVILPYKDSLLLFSRYLQQLVMESLGKEFDLDGNRVCDKTIFCLFNFLCFNWTREVTKPLCKNYASIVVISFFFVEFL